MKHVAFFAKATLVQTNTGAYVFPAPNKFLKPEVMAARLILKFKAPPEMHKGVNDAMKNRFEMYEMNLYNTDDDMVYVTAQIFEDGRDPVFFDETYETVLIVGDPDA